MPRGKPPDEKPIRNRMTKRDLRERGCDRKAVYWSQVVTHIAITEDRGEWKKLFPGVPLFLVAALWEWGRFAEESGYNGKAVLLGVGKCPSGTGAPVPVAQGGTAPSVDTIIR